MFDMNKELEEYAHDSSIAWDALAGKTVLVTGVTGFVGSCLVRLLVARNKLFGANVRVIAPVRNIAKGQELFGVAAGKDVRLVAITDIADIAQLDIPADYLIHTACPTASRTFVEKPVETIASIVNGTQATLEYARKQQVSSYVYVSSMEVYGTGSADPNGAPLTPADMGSVNPLSVRSSYPEGKRMAECLCCAYVSEYKVPVKIVRLAQTFGPGVPANDNRVFMQFARSAMTGNDIILKTTGESTSMYCYTLDAATALLQVLLRGEMGAVYNVANKDSRSSIRQMAQMVADECAGGQIHVVVDVDENAPYPPEHHLALDTSAIRALGWKPRVSLVQMYHNLIAYLEGCQEGR